MFWRKCVGNKLWLKDFLIFKIFGPKRNTFFYRASTRRCELSEKVEIEIPAHVVVKSGWMVYSKIPSMYQKPLTILKKK